MIPVLHKAEINFGDMKTLVADSGCTFTTALLAVPLSVPAVVRLEEWVIQRLDSYSVSSPMRVMNLEEVKKQVAEALSKGIEAGVPIPLDIDIGDRRTPEKLRRSDSDNPRRGCITSIFIPAVRSGDGDFECCQCQLGIECQPEDPEPMFVAEDKPVANAGGRMKALRAMARVLRDRAAKNERCSAQDLMSWGEGPCMTPLFIWDVLSCVRDRWYKSSKEGDSLQMVCCLFDHIKVHLYKPQDQECPPGEVVEEFIGELNKIACEGFPVELNEARAATSLLYPVDIRNRGWRLRFEFDRDFPKSAVRCARHGEEDLTVRLKWFMEQALKRAAPLQRASSEQCDELCLFEEACYRMTNDVDELTSCPKEGIDASWGSDNEWMRAYQASYRMTNDVDELTSRPKEEGTDASSGWDNEWRRACDELFSEEAKDAEHASRFPCFACFSRWR